MSNVEYKVVPAPRKGVKAKGIKGPDAQFAHSCEQVLNEMATEGWQYLRAETLPHDTRAGLTSTTTTYRHILIFSRAISTEKTATTSEPETAIAIPPQEPPITASNSTTNDESDQPIKVDAKIEDEQNRLRSVFDDQ